ncbi:MAG: hypothetical protein SFW67_23205 [Myxococcaceae bacterium]|nr:hypothetical protein [Myxococcaceae bacterium]
MVRRVVVAASLALACSPPVSSADCTTGTPCSSGQVCNPTTRRCELAVTPGATGGGVATGGGAAAGGSATGGGSTGGGSAGGSGVGGGGAGGGAAAIDAGIVSAWTLSIDVSALNRPLPATCYVGQMVPSTIPQVPPTMMVDAVLFDAPEFPTLALDPMAPLVTLGNAPAIELPDAIANGERDGGVLEFQGERQLSSLGPTTLGRSAIELRTSETTVTVTSRSATSVAGTFTLEGRYACVDNGTQVNEQCPRAAPFAPDAATCRLTVPFTGQRRATLPSWARSSTAMAGTDRWALFREERFVDNAACYVGNRVPQARFSTRNLRRLHHLQRVSAPTALAIEDLSFSLGQAPLVEVDAPLTLSVNQYRFTRTTMRMGPVERNRTALETRTGTVRMPFAPVDGVASDFFTVDSQYVCMSGGPSPMQQCPAGTPSDPLASDAVNCSVAVGYVAYQLP